MRTFFIAEAGVNHNGCEELASKLIDVASNAGADAVKFQTFTAEKLVTKNAQKADYQKNSTGEGSQFEMLKTLELSLDVHHRLFQRCSEVGIEFMSTPFDEDAVDFLLNLGMKRIKVPSGEITNFPFIEYLAEKNVPLIVSTGMADLQEVQEVVQLIDSVRKRKNFQRPLNEMLTLLHCTSNYPASCEDVNLRAMSTMSEVTRLPVGYSDHTLGTSVSTAAVALGACVIEKHFTLDRSLNGPDHAASLDPEELKLLISNIRSVEAALGSHIKKPTPSEMSVRSVVRRSIVAKRHLVRDRAIASEDLIFLRPGKGIEPKHIQSVVGKILMRDVGAGETLSWDDFQ